MAADKVLIRLEGVEFAYPGRPPLLKGVDFEIREGERVGIVGPNGSGKTTLFHIIMGLKKPSAGRVEIMGREMRSEADFQWARRRVGFLFQDSDDQLFLPTVEEDVAFGPLNLGSKHDEARAVVRDVLADLGMGGFEKRVTYRLSGGEKRIVAFATVLAMRPEVLLLDEPTTALSDSYMAKIADILGKTRAAYVVVSHDGAFFRKVAGRYYSLDDGLLKPVSSASAGGASSHFHDDSARP
jgi:cobalt/nickel transport system ATP-binding protein